jgi:hypothetical protein
MQQLPADYHALTLSLTAILWCFENEEEFKQQHTMSSTTKLLQEELAQSADVSQERKIFRKYV